ncbi:hypothetical protein ACA910_008285 [Epithemia clementina (nom. ined.)]
MLDIACTTTRPCVAVPRLWSKWVMQIAFSTNPIDVALLEPIRKLAAPAQFTLVVDNRGLQAKIQDLSPIRRTKFLERCNVSSPENLTWWSNCPGRIAYNWQTKFRAWHIWKHPSL